jgi:tripartite-type tricarboxylate transporter receptor subunit TctC
MKRFLSLVLVFCLGLGLFGCTSSTPSLPNSSSIPPEIQQPASPSQPGPADAPSDGIPMRPANYPNKQLTIICPFAAGGAIDNSLRAMLPILKNYGVNAIVTNVTGSSGAVGAMEAINANPDGYTVSTIGPAFVSSWAQGLLDFSWDDCVIITRTTMDTNGWFVATDSEFNTAQEVIDWIISHPGEFTLGIAGNNESQNMILTEALKEELGGQNAITILGYEGASRAATEVIGGHIMAATGKMADFITHIQAGTMKPVMSLADGKTPVFDDSIQTFNELPYPDIVPLGDPAANTTFLVGNPNIPPEVVDYLYQVFKLVLESEEYQKYAANAGSIAQPISPEECKEAAKVFYQLKYDEAVASGLI